jgi:cell division protein FtsW (lipid II flippase)
MLFVCAVLCVIVALVVALGVIPLVNADTDPSINHEKVTAAFWINIGLTLLSAVSLFVVVIRAKERSWKSTSVFIIAGFLVLILGLALAQAAAAYRNASPPLQSASMLLAIGAVVDSLVGLAIIVVAFLRPQRVE